MSLLHVLLAVARALRGIGAWLKAAAEKLGGIGVLVVHVAVTLFLGGPANLEIFARSILALPGARVGLLMFASRS
jgi:hypothetical protein